MGRELLGSSALSAWYSPILNAPVSGQCFGNEKYERDACLKPSVH